MSGQRIAWLNLPCLVPPWWWLALPVGWYGWWVVACVVAMPGFKLAGWFGSVMLCCCVLWCLLHSAAVAGWSPGGSPLDSNCPQAVAVNSVRFQRGWSTLPMRWAVRAGQNSRVLQLPCWGGSVCPVWHTSWASSHWHHCGVCAARGCQQHGVAFCGV